VETLLKIKVISSHGFFPESGSHCQFRAPGSAAHFMCYAQAKAAWYQNQMLQGGLQWCRIDGFFDGRRGNNTVCALGGQYFPTIRPDKTVITRDPTKLVQCSVFGDRLRDGCMGEFLGITGMGMTRARAA
jgi:hypothetical protein